MHRHAFASFLVTLTLATLSYGCGVSCPPKRTALPDGTCVADAVADYSGCVLRAAREKKLSKEQTEKISAAVKTAAEGPGAETGVEVREKLEQEFSTLNDKDIKTVLADCRALAGVSSYPTPENAQKLLRAMGQEPQDQVGYLVLLTGNRKPEGRSSNARTFQLIDEGEVMEALLAWFSEQPAWRRFRTVRQDVGVVFDIASEKRFQKPDEKTFEDHLRQIGAVDPSVITSLQPSRIPTLLFFRKDGGRVAEFVVPPGCKPNGGHDHWTTPTCAEEFEQIASNVARGLGAPAEPGSPGPPSAE